MTATPLPGRRPSARSAARPVIARRKLPLADGQATTVYVARHDPARTEPRVVVMTRPQPLQRWCADHGIREALVGGFFVRLRGTPLGEIRTSGVLREHVGFEAPWSGVRACLHVEAGVPRIALRHELPSVPRGDLLQAGPLLVRDGRPYFDAEADAEGFSAAAHQFDSDITEGRHPRAALGIAGDSLVAVVCDGRARSDAGLRLDELAQLMTALGCASALNLDGGGSASLVSGGRLYNRPRGGFESPVPGGRPISTAVAFAHRS